MSNRWVKSASAVVSSFAAPRRMPVSECRDLVAIAAESHRAPAATPCARHVGKEKTASRIGTEPEASGRPLDENFRGRPGDRGEQPLEAAFPGDEFQSPLPVIPNQFVVPFGNAKDFVHRFNPFAGDSFLANHGAENLAKCFTEARCAGEQSVGGLRITLGKDEEVSTSFWRDNAGGFEEPDEVFPIAGVRKRRGVGEINGKTATEKRQVELNRCR
jgi:hypothetical protein